MTFTELSKSMKQNKVQQYWTDNQTEIAVEISLYSHIEKYIYCEAWSIW